MRTARIVRIILSFFIYLFSITMSLTSILAGVSAIQILTVPGNIALPSGPVYTNIDLSLKSQENYRTELNFSITNSGYFDLTDVSVDLTIIATYLDADTKKNKTITLFSKTISYPDIGYGETFEGEFNSEPGDFNYDEIPELAEMDLSQTPEFYADCEFTCKYGVQLYGITVVIENIELSKFKN